MYAAYALFFGMIGFCGLCGLILFGCVLCYFHVCGPVGRLSFAVLEFVGIDIRLTYDNVAIMWYAWCLYDFDGVLYSGIC